MDAPGLSVITVTHGRLALLARKAEALRAQSMGAERFEWCVTTNGDPEAAQWLEGLDEPFAIKVIERPDNGSVASARNLAVAAAAGEVLLLSDDDVLPGPACLEQHWAAHQAAHRAAARPAAESSATAPTRPVAGRVVIGALRLPGELRSGTVREPFEVTASLAGRALWVNATGANTSLPRRDFEAVGGYDPAFAHYGGEDSDLALRLRRRGSTFWRAAAAWATHVGRILTDTDKAYLAGRAGVKVWRKNGGAGAALLLGVHPLSLAGKRLLLGTALRRLYDHETAAYEEAYARGARDELRGALPPEPAPLSEEL